jgi:hypothetical protein
MNVSVEHAYATACRLLGQAQVEAELLAEQLERVTVERDEAGARIVSLTASAPDAEE